MAKFVYSLLFSSLFLCTVSAEDTNIAVITINSNNQENNDVAKEKAIKGFLDFGQKVHDYVITLAKRNNETPMPHEKTMDEINAVITLEWLSFKVNFRENPYLPTIEAIFKHLMIRFRESFPELYNNSNTAQTVGAIAVFFAGYAYVKAGMDDFVNSQPQSNSNSHKI